MPRTTANTNQSLNVAARNKNDEFYTQLSDIEDELRHYKAHFKGKVVYCNCDDPSISNFFTYFSEQFDYLGLKKLITTCYKSERWDLFSKNDSEKGVYLEYEGEKNGGKIPTPEEIGKHPLNGNGEFSGGDFRSDECIDLLKQADIVVTNPPFSLFRQYIAQLIKYDKKFLVIGSLSAVSYKEIFPYFRDSKIWIGATPMGKDMLFDVPEDAIEELMETKEEGKGYKIVDGVIKARAPTCWFTNLDHKIRHQEIDLCREYTPEDYPAYDNYNAIHVSTVYDIPKGYDGYMGLPNTFLDKHNPDQFELVGSDYDIKEGKLPELVKDGWTDKMDRPYLHGKRLFSRLFVKVREA